MYPSKRLSIVAISELGPPFVAVACSRFLETKSKAIRKSSSSFSKVSSATCVISFWHRGASRVDCLVAGREMRELGRETRDWGRKDALETGLAYDALDGGRWDKLEDGR
jgi:hypothetical protein